MTVEKVFDELRIGAKDLSSWVIAGSLRNAFSPSNSEDRVDCIPGSETAGAKLRCRKGNSPGPPNKAPKLR